MNFHIKHLPALSSQQPLQKRDVDADTVVWVPSEQIVMHQLAPPTAPKRKWSELIPWLLEDRILGKVEAMHFVLLGQQSAQVLSQDSEPDVADSIELSVITAANETMEFWLELLEGNGLSNCQLLPDFLALPWQEGEISVALRDGIIVVRHDEFNGFAAVPQLAWSIVQKLQREASSPLSIVAFMPPEKAAAALQAGIQQVNGPIDWAEAHAGTNISLLTGKFRQQQNLSDTRYWLSSAALLLVCLGLGFAYISSLNANLNKQLENTQNQYASEFRRLFPGLALEQEGVHFTVEQYLQSRFRQRESLDTNVSKILRGLDRVISGCNSCTLNTLSLNQNGGELNLNGRAQVNSSQISVPGFRFTTSTLGGTESTLLTISRD